ncbi:MAG: hypothetical protein KDD48_04010 [Bdellovibrionales bacterium]|nr:hypothetical protein [Bdellovibrionales bacterium]
MALAIKKLLLSCLLLIGIFISFFAGLSAFETVGKPYLGILPFNNLYIGAFTQHDSANQNLDLDYHDRLLAINDTSIQKAEDISALLQHHTNGQTYELRIESNGKQKTLKSYQTLLSANNVFKIFAPLSATAIAFFMIAILVLLIKPEPKGSAAFTLYCISMGVYLISAYDFHTTYQLIHPLFISISFLPATIIHMSLDFPDQIFTKSQRIKIRLGAYVLSFVIFIPYDIFFWGNPKLWSYFEHACFFYISLSYIFWVWSMIFRYRHTKDSTIRKQSRHILLAIVPGFGFIFVLVWLTFIFKVPVPLNYVAPFCLLFPIVLVGAMFRSNLFLVQTLEHQIHERTETLRKKELELFQTHKLASVGLLASGTAHEIGNAMNVIVSNLPILKKYIDLFMSKLRSQSIHDSELIYALKDTPDLLNDLDRSSHRALDIMNHLKYFAKPDISGKILFQVEQALESTLKWIKRTLPKGISIQFEKKVTSPIEAVPGQLEQVFLNLLFNAVEALGEKGTISIDQQEKEGHIVVSIHDTGPGILEKDLHKIFDPFFTTKTSGTGLGLSVSYGIIKSHGGTLEVESNPAQGTTFKIKLPIGHKQ